MDRNAVPIRNRTLLYLLFFLFSSGFTHLLTAQDCTGGTVSLIDGTTSIYTCPGDGISDSLTFQVEGNVGSNFSYVITDTAGVILGIPEGEGANFEGAGEGICLVWGLAYEGTLTAQVGDTASLIDLADTCFSLSGNFVTVNRGTLDGGTLLTTDGASAVYTCPGDSVADVVSFAYTSSSLANFQLVITDTAGVILGLPDSTVADFEGAGPGTCLAWALQYTDTLLAQTGDSALTTQLATGCFALSEAPVTINRGELDGGMITAEGDVLQVYTCPGDSIADEISFNFSSSNLANFQLVITDEQGIILGLPDSTIADFEGAGEGTCLVWGLNYTGTLAATVGDTATGLAFSDGCFALSDTFVTITRGSLDGGEISAEGGSLEVTTCNGDSLADVVSFSYSSASLANFQLVITDEQGIILGLPDSTVADFEGAGAGTCLAWGLSYTGTLTATVGDTATGLSFSAGCFALSDTFVTVNRIEIEAPLVLTAGEQLQVFTCPGDSVADVVEFIVSADSLANFQLVITDEEGNILGLPDTTVVDFEEAGIGNCLVWGLSYTDTLTTEVGANALEGGLAAGCYQLSDTFVTVNRISITPPSVSTQSGALAINTCPGDSIPDVVAFSYTGDSAANFAFVVTDTDGIIVGLPDSTTVDFEGAGEGVCLVWGLSYVGTLSAELGDNAAEASLSNGCFVLSDTFVTVTRGQLDGGMVYAAGELLTVYTCPGDSAADVVSFSHSSNSLANSQLVVTDTAGTILGLPDSTLVDFEDAGEGTCLVWGLSYTDSLTASVGDNAFALEFATGCFALSDTFVTVIRGQLDGGMIYAEGELLEVYTCPDDSIADVVSFAYSSASLANFQLVITDTAGIILGLPDSTVADFEGAGAGTCLAWGLQYTGNLTAAVGDTAIGLSFSDGCFALTDTFVTVNRGELVSGTITTEDGSMLVETCPGDSVADVITFMATSSSTSNFQLVITDPNGVILGLPEGNSADFEGAGVGVCYVWGLNYGGTLLAQVGDTAVGLMFSDACFALSDTFVTVNRSEDNCISVSLTKDLNEGAISVFPNPVQDRVTIVFEASSQIGQKGSIEMYDLQGRRLIRHDQNLVAGQENRIELPVPTLGRGVYIIRIVNGDKFLTQRIVKN